MLCFVCHADHCSAIKCRIVSAAISEGNGGELTALDGTHLTFYDVITLH